MASYLEKKRQAIGLELIPNPFNGNSEFKMVPQSLGQMRGSGFETNWEIPLTKDKDNDDQSALRFSMMRWPEEYETDKKAAHEDLAELNGYLRANNYDEIHKLLQKRPVTEWLNIVFLEEEEINDLTNLLIKASPECRSTVANAIREGLDSLLNFKTCLECILDALTRI